MNSSVAGGRIHIILNHLVKHGWVTLRSMSALLGYAHPTGIYGRQRSKKPIPTVFMGSTHRVYAEDVVETLKNAPEQDQASAGTILHIYNSLLKEHSDE